MDQREVLAKEGKESQLVGQKGEGRQAAATFSKGKQEKCAGVLGGSPQSKLWDQTAWKHGGRNSGGMLPGGGGG